MAWVDSQELQKVKTGTMVPLGIDDEPVASWSSGDNGDCVCGRLHLVGPEEVQGWALRLEPWFQWGDMMEPNYKLGLIVASVTAVVLAIVILWDSRHWRRMM